MITTDITPYFKLGDELMLESTTEKLKVWVLGFNSTKTGLLLINEEGNYIDYCGTNYKVYKFKIVRSGNRNLQSASMSSVTSMINPLKDTNGDSLPDILDQNSFIFNANSNSNPRIINSSAVVYNDFWKPQNDMNIATVYPTLPGVNPEISGEVSHPYQLNYNPFLWNIKGEWRAEKSYAYLTGRNSSSNQVNNPRNEGFFTSFAPFYQLINGAWSTVNTNWTYASSVTQFSPFGMELENKDALDRYSAAQYGYQNKLPVAVASNAKYREIGYEGFEETQNSMRKHFVFSSDNQGSLVPVTISNTQSHTGKRSVKVTPSTPVKIVRSLMPEVITASPRFCFYDCSEVLNIPMNINGSNMTIGTTADNIPQYPYVRYKISPVCNGLTVEGQSVATHVEGSSVNYVPGSYTFTTVPGQPDSKYLTYYGIINLLGNTNYSTAITIPIRLNGVSMNLRLVRPYYDSLNTTNGQNRVLLGSLECQ